MPSRSIVRDPKLNRNVALAHSIKRGNNKIGFSQRGLQSKISLVIVKFCSP